MASGKILATKPDSATRNAPKPARPAAAPSYTQLSAALGALPARTEQFVRIPSLRAERITLVDVRNLFRETSQQKEFETSIADRARQITAMRSTLQNSLVLRDLLFDRQLKMSQVVAVDPQPDGSAVVFYVPE
ncbi:MAG: hypothetical protein V4617_17220 [Gemmatimonadota bacterium]